MWYQTLREIWGPTAAQLKYDGRLGNTKPGEGKLFMGRGIFQNTGRTNYELVQNALQALGMVSNCVNTPTELERPKDAAWAAGIFWGKNNLNPVADADTMGARISRAINREDPNSPKPALDEAKRCAAFQHALHEIAAATATVPA